MHRCQKVVAPTASSTESSTSLTALVAALVAGATAGTVLPSWFATPVTEVPTVATVFPTPAATGDTGLLPLEPGDAPGIATRATPATHHPATHHPAATACRSPMPLQ